MKIAVLDDYSDAFRATSAFERLSAEGYAIEIFRDTERDAGALASRLAGADVVLLTQQRSAFPREVIEKLDTVRWIAQTGRGTAHIDVAACKERGIRIVMGTPPESHATAELTWALILASLRHLPTEARNMKEGRWQTTIGQSVRDQVLGIYALGRIGSAVARVGQAFGMKVIVWGRERSLGSARDAGYEPAASRAAFFEQSDVLSLHIPLNDATRGLVTAEDLGRMKTTALLVNTSRARIIEDGALVRALQAGRPGFAAVDVYEDEPVLGASHPLLSLPNALCTPHIGYAERGTYEAYYRATIDALLHELARADG